MSPLGFMSTGLAGEDAVVLQAWESFVARLPVPFPVPGAWPRAEAVRDMCESMLGEGWMGLASGPDARLALCAEAVQRFFRREVPVPLPLIELWMGARVHEAFGITDSTALLSLDDLFRPSIGAAPQTGWLPFPGAFDFLVVVAEGDGAAVHVLEAGGAQFQEVPVLDPSSPVGRARLLKGVAGLPRLGTLDHRTWEQMRAQVLVLQAAALSGQAQALLEATLAYLSVRVQFGVLVGSFQALKHRCADLATELHAANLLCDYAAASLDDHPDAVTLAAMAKSQCGRAALAVASDAIQLHGGMGFTWECSAQLGFKRTSFLAMNGLPIGACEQRVGRWAAGAKKLHWPA